MAEFYDEYRKAREVSGVEKIIGKLEDKDLLSFYEDMQNRTRSDSTARDSMIAASRLLGDIETAWSKEDNQNNVEHDFRLLSMFQKEIDKRGLKPLTMEERHI